jgi:hypothetical protein
MARPNWFRDAFATLPLSTDRRSQDVTQPTAVLPEPLIRKCAACGKEDTEPHVTYFDATPSHHIDCKKEEN